MHFIGESLEVGPGTVWVEMTEGSSAGLTVEITGVEAVLHLHACVVTKINIVTPCLLLSIVVLNAHVNIKSLISFLLTVLDTSQLRFLLRRHKLKLNAILMALLKQYLWKSMLLQSFEGVIRVPRPVRVRHYFSINLIDKNLFIYHLRFSF